MIRTADTPVCSNSNQAISDTRRKGVHFQFPSTIDHPPKNAYTIRTPGYTMNNSKLIAFVATKNPSAALKFYQETLGLKLVEDNPFAVVFDANGVMLRVQKVHDLTPAKHTALGWEVPNIAEKIKELMGKGIHFERFPGVPHDELGIWTSPSRAKIAWFKDPDGNILSLTQF
jgi:catechol 2,3-dioxygenase-like lactoylglutathione lyase family enzyme